jgi:hypothetical protein
MVGPVKGKEGDGGFIRVFHRHQLMQMIENTVSQSAPKPEEQAQGIGGSVSEPRPPQGVPARAVAKPRAVKLQRAYAIAQSVPRAGYWHRVKGPRQTEKSDNCSRNRVEGVTTFGQHPEKPVQAVMKKLSIVIELSRLLVWVIAQNVSGCGRDTKRQTLGGKRLDFQAFVKPESTQSAIVILGCVAQQGGRGVALVEGDIAHRCPQSVSV